MRGKLRPPGEGANHDRKVALMRAATTAAVKAYNSGGGVKMRGPRAKAVTLPTIEMVRRLDTAG